MYAHSLALSFLRGLTCKGKKKKMKEIIQFDLIMCNTIKNAYEQKYN